MGKCGAARWEVRPGLAGRAPCYERSRWQRPGWCWCPASLVCTCQGVEEWGRGWRGSSVIGGEGAGEGQGAMTKARLVWKSSVGLVYLWGWGGGLKRRMGCEWVSEAEFAMLVPHNPACSGQGSYSPSRCPQSL